MGQEIDEFTQRELERLARERDEAIKAKGGLPYLGAIPVGESKLELQAKIPRDDPDRDGRPRKQFTVKKPSDTQEYAWTVNSKSPLYRDLLQLLPKAPIWIRIIRTGEGRSDTRYTVKQVE